MLKKLFKYDMKYIAGIMKIVYIIAIASSLLMGVGILLSARWEAAAAIILIDALPFIISVCAISVSGFVAIAMRINKNLYTDQGYLTFTLPVKTSDIILSKVLAGAAWELLGALMALVCVAIPLTFAVIGYKIDIKVIEYVLDNMLFMFYNSFGREMTVVLGVLTVISALVSCVFQPICILTAFSIGQKAKSNRVLASLFAYFCINTVFDIVSGIIQTIVMSIAGVENAEVTLGILGTLNVLSTGVSLILSLAFTAGAYVYVKNVMENKLNLI